MDPPTAQTKPYRTEPADDAGSWLLLDAAGPRAQVALWRQGDWVAIVESGGEAGTELFAGVESVLAKAGTGIGEVAGFLFCRGPGSQLGIRIAAMAIHGWQALRETPLPVYGYTSHGVLAARLLREEKEPPLHLLSDARRGQWMVTTVDHNGEIHAPVHLPATDLNKTGGPYFRMEERRPSPCPVAAEVLCYSLLHDAALFRDFPLAHPLPVPEPLPWRAPEFRKWTSSRHR